MKYFYLFILFAGIATHSLSDKAELNTEQGIQIDCLITTDQDEGKGVIKKANGLAANTPYYIGEMFDEVTPMAASDQFVKPVHKFGLAGRDAVPIYGDDSLKAVIPMTCGVVRKKKQQNGGWFDH